MYGIVVRNNHAIKWNLTVSLSLCYQYSPFDLTISMICCRMAKNHFLGFVCMSKDHKGLSK